MFNGEKTRRRQAWAEQSQEKVIMHSFDRPFFTPSISPFPVKLETFMRMSNIPYEMDTTEQKGPKGKTPWVTFQGKAIADSQIIMELLAKHYNIDHSSHLSDEEKATARAFAIMTDEHLYWPVALDRWVYNKGKALSAIAPFPSWMRFLIPLFTRLVSKQAEGQGTGRHTQNEVEDMGKKDVHAISQYLGSKPFLMGDKACEVDCSVFGMLTQMVWNSPGSYYEKLVTEDYPNLREYCFRMKEKFWPDWDEIIAKKEPTKE